MGLSSEHLDEDLGVENVDGDKVLGFLQWVYNIVHLLLLISLAAIPTLLLNLPVGMLAGLYAERRRVKALAKSKVKVRGFDVRLICSNVEPVVSSNSFFQVMLTEKVVFCLVMLPTLWIFYGAMMYCFTNLDGPTIALALLSMPLFAYIGIIVTEAGMIDWQDLRPYCMRIFPSTRKRLLQLPGTRKKLQEDLRAFIKSIGEYCRCQCFVVGCVTVCSCCAFRSGLGRDLLQSRVGLETDPREVAASKGEEEHVDDLGSLQQTRTIQESIAVLHCWNFTRRLLNDYGPLQ